MISLLVSVVAALGVYYLYTASVLGWKGANLSPRPDEPTDRLNTRVNEWMAQAGLHDVRVGEFALVMVVLFFLGAALAYALFGGLAPPLLVGVFAATFPPASYKIRRRRRRDRAHQAWPRLIEEMRVLTGSVGRSIPQALFEVGERAPEEMHAAFEAAHREWLISTDFESTIEVLKKGLADPTADVTCETLLVAHQVGGSDLQARLVALAEDRSHEVQDRQDAEARQAGARFARWFVLAVPVGMALTGMSIGNGRAAYQTALGQALVVLALLVTMACWLWAGAIMVLPEEDRVFDQ